MIKQVIRENKIELCDSVLREFNFITIDKWGVLKGFKADPHQLGVYYQWEACGDKGVRLAGKNLALTGDQSALWYLLKIEAVELISKLNRPYIVQNPCGVEVFGRMAVSDNVDISDHTHPKEMRKIPAELYDKLNYLGLLKPHTWEYNEGESNYATKIIQPWAIWLDYPELTAWDLDMIKRILRTKKGEPEVMKYKKIIHDAQERIRQLENDLEASSSLRV